MTSPHLFALLASAAVLVLAALSGFSYYFNFIESPYLTYGPQPFPLGAETVEAGQVMPVWVTRCNKSGIVQFYRVTHILQPLTPGLPPVVMPSELTHIEPRCETVKSTINKIPAGTAPGRYFIDGGAEVPGTRKVFYVPWSTPPFDITEAAK